MTKETRYPLTASQRMLEQALEEFGDAQVLTIGVCVSIQAPVDFSLLEECLTEEIRRFDCLRIRFTPPDETGTIRQYIVKESEQAIPFRDLRNKSAEEIHALMSEWSTIGFSEHDAPLLRLVMVALPGGKNGVYLCIDHRIMDSLGLVSMMNDTFALYFHRLCKMAAPVRPASYENVLQADLKREQDPVRLARDLRFWKQRLAAGEPIYTDFHGTRVLEESRIRHGLPALRAADRIIKPMDGGTERFTMPKKDAERLLSYCKKHAVSLTNVLLMAIHTALSFANDGEPDISIKNYVSRRTAKESRTCGGCRIHCYPCRAVITPDVSFPDGIRLIQSSQNDLYRHSDLDPAIVERLFADAFHMTPQTTYEGAALTCQPLPLSFSNPALRHIPLDIEWFSSGADIQKLYLTVMHAPQNGGLDFYFKYQKAAFQKEEIAAVYERLAAILALAPDERLKTIKDIMREL